MRARTGWNLPSPRQALAQGSSGSPALHRRPVAAEDRLILLALIDAVDETGYLRADLMEVAATGWAPTSRMSRPCWACCRVSIPSAWRRAIWRNAWRCNSRLNDRLDPAMQALLTHLDLVARRDMGQLTALCGVDAEDIADMISEIRQLNPRPGLAFGSEPVTPVVPDVFVRVGPDGGWLVELNSDTLPRLLVNNQYYGTVAKGARDKDSKNLPRRLPQQRQLAGQKPGPARPHHPQSGLGDRAPPGRVPDLWRAPSAPAQSAHHRRRDL